MVLGCGEEAWDVGKGLGEKKGKEMVAFPLPHEHKARNTQVFLLSGKGTSLTLQKSYRISQWSECGQLSYEPPEQISR